MKQLIAMGGGGFSMEPDNPLLDEYILNQSTQKKPKICFIPTASGDSQEYIDKFYEFFQNQNCEASHLSLFKLENRDIEGFIMKQDILYVGGGSTKSMLALWREWGVDVILKKAWDNGILLAGISAGAICWFEEGLTDSYGDQLEPLPCLGFVKGSCCPHYDGEKDRRPSFHNAIKEKSLGPGYALDDGAAVHFIDEEVHQAVCSRPSAKAMRVWWQEGKVIEKLLPMKYLY
ncbi:Type 1 glutamine amidotransferase-like domain-containing protein [Halobacillus salinus]|uniref:Peptidase E n=1 Tax=Halobacillus salinus TaxID=192814 RepID=A0A4Z0GZ27_9BACI|nr:Type 1 glutamine amidotransferase-like domain-containing protein [Halobacillus salinus]TGB01934.1 peptidase E [Halobacillus salinus]